MQTVREIAEAIVDREGGFVNDPDDPGGATNFGVTIHTITFGRDADRRRMVDVASIGGGRHFHADNGTQLKQIYREIALTLSTMMTQ